MNLRHETRGTKVLLLMALICQMSGMLPNDTLRTLLMITFRHVKSIEFRLSVRVQYFQCVSSGDTAVLH